MAPYSGSAYCESVGSAAVDPSLHPSIAQARVAPTLARWGLNLFLAGLWLWFARDHLVFWASTGDLRGVGTMAMETLVAVLFLTRRSSIDTSREPLAWLATVVGA